MLDEMVTSVGSGSSFTFSTSEQATNLKWINDEIIYTKSITVSGTVANNAKIDSALTRTNCELISALGSVKNSSDNSIYPLNFSNTASDKRATIYISSDGAYFTVLGFTAKDLKVTLWYVKTS